MKSWRPRFTLATNFWIVLVAGVVLAWYVDHKRQQQLLSEWRLSPLLDLKPYHWSPSLYLQLSTGEIEDWLATRMASPSGPVERSPQGMSDRMLRRPTLETLDAAIGLLNHSDATVVHLATQLVALYLEASAGSNSLSPESMEIRLHFHQHGLTRMLTLLHHPSAPLRQSAALVLGNALPCQKILDNLNDSWDRETDNAAKVYIAWAIYRVKTLPE